MSTKDCSSEYHELIRKNYTKLIDSIELQDSMVIQQLYSKGTISRRDRQVLQACTNNFDRAEKLLKMFENKSAEQIESLTKTLIETGQDHIVKSFLCPEGSLRVVDGANFGHSRYDQQQELDWPARPPIYDPKENATTTGQEEAENSQGFADVQDIFSTRQVERQPEYTLSGKVIKKTEVESYKKGTGVPVFYFTIKICDATDVTDIRVYHTSKYNKVIVGKCYLFENVIRRAEVFLFVGRSSMCRIPPLDVPEEIERRAERESPLALKENTRRSISMSIEALNSSHIRGKIVKVSPIKHVQGKELPMRLLGLIDDPDMTPVKVAVFADAAKNDYQEGQCVDISYVYKRKTEPQSDAQNISLSTTKEATVQFITDFHECPKLEFLDIKGKAIMNDPDFEEERTVDMKIYAVVAAGIYECCTKRGCYNRKLNEDGLCPVCGGSSSRGRSCWVKVKVEHEGRSTCHSLFKSELDSFIDLRDLVCYSDNEALIDDICDQLPVSGKARFQGDNMTIVTVKRKVGAS